MQGTWCDKNEFISRDRLLTWMGEAVEIKKAHLPGAPNENIVQNHLN